MKKVRCGNSYTPELGAFLTAKHIGHISLLVTLVFIVCEHEIRVPRKADVVDEMNTWYLILVAKWDPW